MTVLLTHAYFLNEDSKEQQIMRPYPPLGLIYISTFLENQGIENEVFDTTFSSKDQFQNHLISRKPDIIGIYVNLMTKLNVLEMIRFIKDKLPKTAIILGGPEVTYSAENFLRYGANYIVIGEGEETMFELVQGLTLNPSPGERDFEDSLNPSPSFAEAAAGRPGERDFRKIEGIAFLMDDVFIQTLPREKIKDLDELPIPNRNKINLHPYLDSWKKYHGKNAISVSTMRGCPYTCKWCSRAVYGLSYRRRSAEKVVEELAMIKRDYNPDSLWFVDDVFTISHKWLTAFRDALKKQNVSIPYECITRADRMNEEVISMLKETGCFRVWIGAESGSQKVIDLMDRRVDVHQVRAMIQLTQQYDIEAGTFIMLGYPGETEEDIEETIHHLKESDPDHFTITVAYPIKGTELYEEIEAHRTTAPDWETSNDRQIDFKRTYSRRYYDYAVKRVISEVKYHSARKDSGLTPSLLRLKISTIISRIGMQWYKNSS